MAETFNISLNQNSSGFLQTGIGNPLAARHGEIIDIPGSGFGPMPTFSFVGGKDGRLETKAIGVDNINSDGWTVSTERPKQIVFDSERGKVWFSVVFDGETSQADNGVVAHNWGSPIVSGSKVFMSWYTKIQCDAAAYQWKHIRQEPIYTFEDGGPESYIMLWKKDTGRYFGTRSAISKFENAEMVYFGAQAYNSIKMDSPEWFGMNWYQVVSSQGVADGTRFFESIPSTGPVTLVDRNAHLDFNADVSDRCQWHVWQNYLGNYTEGSPTVGDVWLDDIYIQVSPPGVDLVRVVLCNNANYSLSTVREIQKPESGWSNTNAQVKLNRGGRPNGQWFLNVIAGKNTQLASLAINLVS